MKSCLGARVRHPRPKACQIAGETMRILLGVLVLGLAAGGCAETITLTPEDNQATVELGPGERFELTLPGNPTTGYAWTVVEGDSTVVGQVGEPEFVAESTLLGAGGEFRFTFEGAAPGTTSLKLAYARSFEDAAPIDEFELSVVVS